MQTQELAQSIVDLCRARHGIEAVTKRYADNVVSNEGPGSPGPARVEGIEAVLGKNHWWYENHDVHDLRATGPFLSGEEGVFSILFEIDVTQRFSGDRIQMNEIAVYRAQDGKVVEETFMFG